MTFSTQDVLDALENGDFRRKGWRTEEMYIIDEGDWCEIGGSSGKATVNGVEYDWESVEHIGGGEGSGEYAAVIFKVGDRLFRKEGCYASHYGTDWDGDFEEVESYEKTVIAYRAI